MIPPLVAKFGLNGAGRYRIETAITARTGVVDKRLRITAASGFHGKRAVLCNMR